MPVGLMMLVGGFLTLVGLKMLRAVVMGVQARREIRKILPVEVRDSARISRARVFAGKGSVGAALYAVWTEDVYEVRYAVRGGEAVSKMVAVHFDPLTARFRRLEVWGDDG